MLTLDERQRRDLLGLGLLALAFLLALSLVPVELLGDAVRRTFVTGNVAGAVGARVRDALSGALGVGALAVPLLAGLWGVVAYRRVDAARALRWTILALGLVLLLPSFLHVVLATAEAAAPGAGRLGATLGGALGAALGTVGAVILLFFLFAALTVVTVGWNPLRTALHGGRFAMGQAGKVASALPKPTVAIPSLDFLRRRPDAAPAADGREDADRDAHEPFRPIRWDGDDDEAEREAPPPSARAALRDAADDAARDAEAVPAEEPEEEDGEPDDDAALWLTGGASGLAGDVPVDPDATLPEGLPVAAGPAARAKPAPAKRPRTVADEQVELLPVDPGDPLAESVPSSASLVAPPPRDEARNRAELDKLGQVLVEKLATFKIEGEIVGMTTGPVVTQFEVSPAPGVKVSRIASLEADLALALRAPSVRIVAPIPGKGAVGVEVPNPAPEMVFFREVIESGAFRSSKAQLPLGLGKDIAGQPYVVDLAKMPHLLIAGATGSGKSVCVNTIITSLIFRHTPRTLRFLMVDPKMVELSMYNDLPHLRHPVVTDNNDAAAVLKWAVLEMERRYELLSVNGVRNLQDFNRRVEGGQLLRSPEPTGEEGDPDRWLYRGGTLPFIVVIIDELADLMMTVQGDVEKPLALLAQKARAIGIHLILATQRPSVNVITGLIKANFPSRIAFRVSSKVDSRTILDQNGADALLGNGDMLLLPPASSEPIRLQGAYLSTEETDALMGWYRDQRASQRLAMDGPAEENILDVVRRNEDSGELEPEEEAGERDKLFRQAAELCIQHQNASTSLLQRRLSIGYGRAARIMDQLERAGIIGAPDGSKGREVLVDFADLDRIVGDDG